MSNLIYANFVAQGCSNNAIFNLAHPLNRDNCYYPYWYLREFFRRHDIELNTPDLNLNNKVAFELHVDAQEVDEKASAYALLIETPQIQPNNDRQDLLSKYRKIFTWNDDLVDGGRHIKINFRNQIRINPSLGWREREKLCCMIAGNKAVRRTSLLELYSERIKTIRWFEEHASRDFDLFGTGWDSPPARSGLIGKIICKLHKKIASRSNKVYFSSYQGRVIDKIDTLLRYRFNICYENVRDLPGYITEKIFDSFFAGCIPVYWGASNIEKYIPKDCFIDRRRFSNHEQLYHFMISMNETEYIAYQERIIAFLNSDQATPFSAESFAEIVVSAIVSDLGITT